MNQKMIALLLAALLVLSGCSGTKLVPGETAETETRETLSAPETDAPDKDEQSDLIPAITHPLTRAEVEAIPVATADMTEEELRQICIDYMALQTSVVWTPDQSLFYDYPSSYSADDEGMLHLEKGKRYGGVPYTQAAIGLEAFLDLYDEESGVLALSEAKNIHQKVGNNCGTAVFWAWQRVSSTISYYGTRQMCLAHGCIPVGEWTYDQSLTDFYTYTTRQVCEDNGADVMMRSYACLKPGDGMTMTVKVKSGVKGHARMVKEVSVSYTTDGSVDPEKSFVICLEQSSKGPDRQTEDGVVLGIGSENKYSFKDLYDKGYLPVTVAELIGAAPVKEASVSLPEVTSLKELSEATLTGAYCISRVDVTVVDQNGKEAFSACKVGSCKPEDQYSFSMSKVLPAATMSRNLKKGESYRVTVTARLGNGETLTALTQDLSY
ncbi:MAG: hypothetical protein J6Z79_01575 [Clostridia bacterium]|nr:hypothetical protein [Clostridia bacterium]